MNEFDFIRRLREQTKSRPQSSRLSVGIRWIIESLIDVSTPCRLDEKSLVVPEAAHLSLRDSRTLNLALAAPEPGLRAAELLISRGRLADAQLAAEQARYRTVQYSETLRRALDATRRNVRAVDWLQSVPDMIAEALDHVADRYRHENAILTNIRKARDESEDPEQKRRAAELVDIVKDCIRRHTQLQSRLLEAGPLFRAEQDRQAFATPTARTGLDLYGQLVAPILPLPAEQAIRVTDAFFARGTGLRTPVSVRVGDLVDILLTPPQEREHLGAEMPEPDLIATPDDSRFSEEQLASAMELLALPHDAPRRLSGLLADARRQDPELPYLVALLAVHAASPPVGTAYRQGEQQLLFAVDDGTDLDAARSGKAGNGDPLAVSDLFDLMPAFLSHHPDQEDPRPTQSKSAWGRN